LEFEIWELLNLALRSLNEQKNYKFIVEKKKKKGKKRKI